MNNAQTFQDAVLTAGLRFLEAVIPDGKLHRVDIEGDRRGSKNGWYIFHDDDLPAGSFGSWKTGQFETWCAKADKRLTQEEREVNRRRFEAARKERETEETKIKTEARQRAVGIWENAKPAPGDHPYLRRKGIKAHGARLHEGRLVIPLRADGELHSLQFIAEDGEKRFLTGGRVSGCYFSIGNPAGTAALSICEGYATGTSIHEATGYPVAIAFNAGNLLDVAKAMRDKFPELPLILCADDDFHTEGNPGITKATEAARSIGGRLAVPDFGNDRPESATDFNDLHQAHGLETVRRCIEAAMTDKTSEEQKFFEAVEKEEPKKGSMARELVEFVTAKGELFHSGEGKGFVTFHAGDHDETWPLDSQGFKEWLCAAFFRNFEKIPSEAALKDGIRALSGKARYDGKQIPVALRCAKVSDGYLIDLCNERWQTAHVTAHGWQIVKSEEVRFWRNSNMRALPMPSKNGDFSKLWDYVNLDPADRPMMLSFLIECFRADTPYPIAELTGGQGAAKSTSQTNLKSLIDPNAVNLRARPKTVDDLFVGATNNYLVSFENVSHLPPEMQDALCVLATGGGYAGRTLYTNAEETAITIKRPVIINGISANATAQDLVDRLIHFDLPTISTRKTTSELVEGFELAKSEIFGALLDLFAESLKTLPDVKIDRLPRMADFAKLGEAVYQAQGLHPGKFMQDYEEMRRESIHRTLDASPVALAIQSYIDSNPMGFDGTVKAAFDIISRHKSESEERFPKSPKGFADAVRRASTALRVIAIDARIGSKTREGITITIRKTLNEVHQVHQVHNEGEQERESVNMVNIVNIENSFHGAATARKVQI